MEKIKTIRAYKGNIPKALEAIYDKIAERFPAVRMTAYLIGNVKPDQSYIIKCLTFISEDNYQDGQSRKDAKSFIDEINAYNETSEW